MTTATATNGFTGELTRFIRFFLQELKPRGKWLTPFNVISIPTILLGLAILYVRFTQGLGSVTNLNQQFPLGLWISFDVITGVAFAGGAYVITFAVYVMRVEKYHPIVRVTVLNGLLAYIFYAGALTLDLGRPWHIINPIIGNSYGYNAVLFLVSWHFLLYMLTMAVEFSPVVAEWARLEKVRKFLSGLTLGAVIFGITLSILHQSGLGALFLMAKPKIHPLWYSEFIPILFFVSSIYAGLAMVVFEGTISHRVFRSLIPKDSHHSYEAIILGLGKGAAVTMFVYYFLQALIFIHEKRWQLITDFWGVWYLIEVLGFVLVPCVMFAYAVRNRNIGVVKVAATLALLGIILNRLNVTMIAFNWYAEHRYYPSWQEYVVTLMVVFTEIWVFRWVVTRMPVFSKT
ncbi:MAG TPA: NrfD/PsrC family molybdoenzyme membrane anchor subunit [Burkholderiales bacterium]